MARKRRHEERKLKTREHVIADLSVNYVERQILLRGYAANRLVSDYSVDLLMTTHTDEGEVENGHVLFQIKASDKLRIHRDGTKISLRVETADCRFWEDEYLPVILVLYDGIKDKAYWLYIQQYLKHNVVRSRGWRKQDRLTLHIPLKNRLSYKAVERFRGFRDQMLSHVTEGE